MGVETELRHRQILDQIHNKGKVYVGETAKMLNVTEVTIRRDLADLAEKGLLKKIYGGAVLTTPELSASVRYRQTQRIDAKKVIGHLASELIKDNDVIYLESGSTCFEIIPYLKKKKDLTVIVNSMYLMRRLAEITGHKIIVIGGQYRHNRMDMVGPAAESAISQMGGFRAFTGADDITIDAGISGEDIVTVTFTRLILKKASEIIFVGDHTKFDKPALYKLADIDELDFIVTNKKPSDEWLAAAKEKKIRLIYPKNS